MKSITLSMYKIEELDTITAITLHHRNDTPIRVKEYSRETNTLYVDNLENVIENKIYYVIPICGEFDTEICGVLKKIEIKTKVKNMENNYYTPEFEDLFIGYECEYLQLESKKPKYFWQSNTYEFTTWKPTTLFKSIYNNKGFVMYPKDLKRIRTKYLDVSDIESLDFEQEESLMNNVLVFIKDKIVISYLPEIHVVIINKRDKEFPKMPAGCLFQGEIKSINELKKILKYLGI